jgi:hypothetical protein
MSRERLFLVPARFWRIFFWEFVQNVPLVVGFLLGLRLWQSGQPGFAVLCVVGGSLLGALAIQATEARIVAGHREPLRAVLVNIAAMSVLMLAVVAYLSAAWSRWWTDLLAGGLVGLALGAAQDVAARSPVGLRHVAAFALAFALGLEGVRLLASECPLLVSALIITSVVTAAISALDYGAAGDVAPGQNAPG